MSSIIRHESDDDDEVLSLSLTNKLTIYSHSQSTELLTFMLQRRGIAAIARAAARSSSSSTTRAVASSSSLTSYSLRTLATMAAGDGAASSSRSSPAPSRVQMVTRHITTSAQVAAAEAKSKAAEPVIDSSVSIRISVRYTMLIVRQRSHPSKLQVCMEPE